MLIILSSHGVGVAAVKGLNPNVVNGVNCRHIGCRIRGGQLEATDGKYNGETEQLCRFLGCLH
jgi:hypothetical protein